ncbi:hypothetical protein BC939DRAFT_500681 [Gamsiella multidivaricata]|uniref:uncharacterized protein n=1 Tax=Gamsiella multidivaricata TaxID=101098 RepID=UPI002221084B|nr:uncharacterized protein BC939DRAFT_500681 [Gamsiella multidivaricata]KAG0360079.1 hypothetical protein BGZ54_009710 [Gamsiella multidivaricata]KAI7828567.1 hypothetical protein BC939DRAFT_500681 [Gamsiella multidivaricata]
MAPVILTTEHLYMVLTSFGVHLTYFYLIKAFVPFIGKNRKRLSWVLTLMTAAVVSVLGPYATFSSLRTVFSEPVPYESYSLVSGHYNTTSSGQFYRHDITFQPTPDPKLNPQGTIVVALDPTLSTKQWPLHDQKKAEQLPMDAEKIIALYKAHDASYSTSWTALRHSRWFFDLCFTPSDSWMSQVAVTFFACYLILDMVCGLLHYRERVTFLAGWFHHTVYTGICYYTVVSGKSHIFASFMILEIPTLIMGLGFIYKSLRNDILFGGTFVLFRVLWDFALTHELVMNRADMHTADKAFLIFKSVMNFKFFIDWVNQQIRLRRRKPAKAVDAILASEDKAVECKSESSLLTKSASSGISSSSSITTIVYQQQKKSQQQSISSRAQQMQNYFRAANDSQGEPVTTPTGSTRVREARTRTASLIEEQSRADHITAH